MPFASYGQRYGVDVSGVAFDDSFRRLRDVVLVDGRERVVLVPIADNVPTLVEAARFLDERDSSIRAAP